MRVLGMYNNLITTTTTMGVVLLTILGYNRLWNWKKKTCMTNLESVHGSGILGLHYNQKSNKYAHTHTHTHTHTHIHTHINNENPFTYNSSNLLD